MANIKKPVLGELAVKVKYKELLAERDALNAKLADNAAAMRDCAAAARLFGFELNLQIDAAQPGLPGIPTPPSDGDGESIKDMTLALLREAGEKGSKASPIRRTIEGRLGRELHYKTIGMTLYRLSEKGLASRNGFVWYITPKGMEA